MFVSWQLKTRSHARAGKWQTLFGPRANGWRTGTERPLRSREMQWKESSTGGVGAGGNRPRGRTRRLRDSVVSFIARLLGLQVPPYVPPDITEGEGSSMMDQPYLDKRDSAARYQESQAALARLRRTYHTK